MCLSSWLVFLPSLKTSFVGLSLSVCFVWGSPGTVLQMQNVLLLFWVCCPDQCYFSYSQGRPLDFRVPQLLGFNSQLAPKLLLSIICLDNQPVNRMPTLAFYLICLSLGHVGLGSNQGAGSHLGSSDTRMSYLPVRISSDVIKLHFHLNHFTAKKSSHFWGQMTARLLWQHLRIFGEAPW